MKIKMSENKEKKQGEIKNDQKTVFGLELGFDVNHRVMRWVGVLFLEVVVILVVVLGLLLPKIKEVQKTRKALVKDQVKVKQMQKKLDQLDEFVVEFGDKKEFFADVFPINKDVGLVLSSVRQISNQTGVDIVGYGVDSVVVENENEDKATKRKVGSFGMEVTVVGISERIQDFLRLMDESLPIKVVNDVKVTSGIRSIEEGGDLLEVKVSVDNYFLPIGEMSDPLLDLTEISEADRELMEELEGYAVVNQDGSSLEMIPVGNTNLFGL